MAMLDRYEYVAELGRGSRGRVVACRDIQEGGRAVALKWVRPEHLPGLLWELARLREVSAPQLAQVFALHVLSEPAQAPFTFPKGSGVLVQQRAEGLPAMAAAAQAARGEPKLPFVYRLVRDGLLALRELHAAGFVHRDVKPDNLVVDAAGHAILVDLELAAPAGFTRELSGTPAYAAPEAWTGQVTPASDIYSLGASLFDLLRGEAPTHDSESSLGANATSRDRVVGALSERVPAPVRELVAAWLSASPDARPGSAVQALSQLDACAEAFGARAQPALQWASGNEPARDVALRAHRLPFVAEASALASLVESLDAGGAVCVVGPAGAGRSRLIREAVFALQLQRGKAGASVPGFEVCDRVPERLRGGIAQIRGEDASLVTQAVAACEAAALEGEPAALLFEAETPLPGIPCVRLEPLSRDAMRRLLAAAFDARPADAVLDAALRMSQGWPGVVCRALADGRGDPRRADFWRGAVGDGSLRAGLDAVCARWLDALALWEAPVDAESLGHPGLGPEGVARLGRRLASRDALREVGGRLCLQAQVARELRASMDAERRAQAINALREATGALPDDAPFVHEGPERVRALETRVRELRAAGEPALSAALLEEAAALEPLPAPLRAAWADALRAQGRYEAALDVLEGVADPTAQLLYAQVARLAGRREASRDCLRALADGEGDAAAHALALLGLLAADVGDLAQARQWLSRVDEPRVGGTEARLALLEVRARCATGKEAELAAEAYVVAASRAGSGRQEARANSLRAGMRPHADPRALSEYLSSYSQASQLGEVHEAASYAFNLGLARLDAGELGGALEMLRRGARGYASLSRPLELGRVLFNWANAWLWMGDEVLAARVVERAERESRAAHDAAAVAMCALVQAELSARAGSVQRAQQTLSDALELAPGAVRTLLAARLSFVLSSMGRVAQAQAVLDGIADSGASDQPELTLAQVRLSLERGQLQDAERTLRPLLDALEVEGAFELRVRALLLGAELARSRDDAVQAELRLARCRSLLDHAMRGLSPAQQARLRSVEQYARAFRASPSVQASSASEDARVSRLLAALPRLFRVDGVARVGEVMCETALELVAAERALWIVREGESDRVAARAGWLRDSQAEGGYSASIVGQAWASGETVSALDAVSDARFTGSESVRALSLRSAIAVPMRTEVGHAALYVDDSLRPSAFRETDVGVVRELVRVGEVALSVARQRERDRGARIEAEQHAKQLADALRDAPVRDEEAIIGSSARLRACLALVDRVAESDLTVLVQGESGTGKELIARRIHGRSPRRAQPFVAENCAALPETLLESALFGHVRGAFTGASKDHRGLFEQADGGTLFLDEVGEMSAGMQAKLLRVLETGDVRPVGGQQVRRVDVRVVSATHRDLARDVDEGRFRQDLFYRLAVVQVAMPALRERGEDIAELVRHFLARHGGAGRQIEPAALQSLRQREFKGNVRELENLVRRALVMADDVIRLEHVAEPSRPAELDTLDLHGQVEALQKRLVQRALAEAQHNQTRAAQLLGISRYGLQKMLRRFGDSV